MNCFGRDQTYPTIGFNDDILEYTYIVRYSPQKCRRLNEFAEYVIYIILHVEIFQAGKII